MAMYLRNDILELSSVLQAMQEAEQLMEAHAYEVNSTHVLQLVGNSACSFYDSEFVALADDLNLQLVTFDKQICSEFSDIAIHPNDFVG
jgi:predicted nucleic acid-binding protein